MGAPTAGPGLWLARTRQYSIVGCPGPSAVAPLSAGSTALRLVLGQQGLLGFVGVFGSPCP